MGNAQHGMNKQTEAKAKRCELTVALWHLFVRVMRMLDRNATEQKEVASKDGQHIRVTRQGPWMLLEHITLPRDLLASNNLLNALMDLAEMLRTWFQRRNEVTIAVAELAVRMNQFEAAEHESEQRTATLKGSIEGLNKTVRQQRNTIETLEHQHEQLAKDMNFLQGTVNEQRELLKQYQLAMMHLTDQTEMLRKSIGIVDEKANTRGLQPPYPSVMGGEYPETATSATVSSVIIRCLSCEQELDPVTSSRVLQNPTAKPYRTGSQATDQSLRTVTVDLPRYARPPSPLSADMAPSSNRVPMHARPQSAAVIRHNQRVLAANARAKRPKSARVVHDNTPRAGELEPSGTHHFEAAAFDKAPERRRASFRARRPLSSPSSGRGRARNGRNTGSRASSGRIEWRSKNSNESKS